MEETVHISGLVLVVFSGILSIMLGIIAFFLSRLLKQFDGLTEQVATLNGTMIRIDKDLSGDVSVLKTENLQLKSKVDDLDPLWERVRVMENKLVGIEAGGCHALDRCKVQ